MLIRNVLYALKVTVVYIFKSREDFEKDWRIFQKLETDKWR